MTTSNPSRRHSNRTTSFSVVPESGNFVRQGDGVRYALNFQFAALTALGGILLGSNDPSNSLAILSILAAVIGFVFVDSLGWFALPATVAYSVMGLSAVASVAAFADFASPGARQLTSVAQLLVVVQVVLILQRKTLRIYEQLSVFCLLDLVVAAVFTDALVYGLMLFPIVFFGAGVLCLMAGVTASQPSDPESEPAFGRFRRRKRVTEATDRDRDDGAGFLRIEQVDEVTAPAADGGVRTPGRWRIFNRLPVIGPLWVIGPGVMLVAATFFYALPRTGLASRSIGLGRGSTLVGFADAVQLGQIGEMRESHQLAVRVGLTDYATGENYRVFGGVYLRGQVLERYTVSASGRNDRSAAWETLDPVFGLLTRPPKQYIPEAERPEGTPQGGGDASHERGNYDVVRVAMSSESARTRTLFSVAPYFQTRRNREVTHQADRWALMRRDGVPPNFGGAYPRITYEFGTHAFHRGIQTDLIARPSADDRPGDGSRVPRAPRRGFDLSQNAQEPDNLGWLRRGIEAIGHLRRPLGRASRPSEFLSSASDGLNTRTLYRQALLEYPSHRIPSARSIAERVLGGGTEAANRRSRYSIAKRLESYLQTSDEFTYRIGRDTLGTPRMDPIEDFLVSEKKGNCQYFASALAMMLRSQKIPARLVVGYHTDEFNELNHCLLARQDHAHAWVEALIPAADLPDDFVVAGQPKAPEYWLRLDPTPRGDLARPPSGTLDKTLDLVQNLWDEYVVDMDRANQQRLIRTTGGDGVSGNTVAGLAAGLVARWRRWTGAMGVDESAELAQENTIATSRSGRWEAFKRSWIPEDWPTSAWSPLDWRLAIWVTVGVSMVVVSGLWWTAGWLTPWASRWITRLRRERFRGASLRNAGRDVAVRVADKTGPSDSGAATDAGEDIDAQAALLAQTRDRARRYYRQTLRQLRRIGLRVAENRTPGEVVDRVEQYARKPAANEPPVENAGPENADAEVVRLVREIAERFCRDRYRESRSRPEQATAADSGADSRSTPESAVDRLRRRIDAITGNEV